MKRLITILLLLVVAVAAHARHNYISVVQEGWRWIGMATLQNVYADSVLKKHFYAIEARGDSVLEGVTYKKYYSYILFGEPFDWEKPYMPAPHDYPYALLHDENGVVRLYDNIGFGVFPDPLYDFSNYEEKVKLEFREAEKTGITKVGDYEAYEYEVEGGIVVEGVGYVSAEFGDLFDYYLLFINSSAPVQGRWGLCLLEDSTGKVLYKGPNYDAYIAEMQSIADISGDGRVDVADINAAVSAVMGVGENAKADVNGDGKVDIADINAVLNVMLNK